MPWLFLVLLLLGCDRPAPEGFVQDGAGLLASREVAYLSDYHERLLRELDIHLQLVILEESPRDIDRTVLELFEQLGIGETSAGARGVLLLVDPAGNQVRMEVGYDLEGLFTDLLVARIEHEQLGPFFASGKVGQGVVATTELLVAEALRHDAPAEDRPTSRLRHLSGGAGARAEAAIMDLPAEKTRVEGRLFLPGGTPLETLGVYRRVLAERVKDPDLPLYTADTRTYLGKWLVTDGQQREELATLEAGWPRVEEVVAGELAAVRFPPGLRQNAPYLMRRSDAGWQLDFAAMSRLISFNHRNQWRFRRLDGPYAELFADWRFDTKGFPVDSEP